MGPQNQRTDRHFHQHHSLQEQLLHKDIPALIKASKSPCEGCFDEGDEQFCVPQKDERVARRNDIDSLQEAEEVQRMDAWAKGPGCNGERSSIPFTCSSAAWEKVGAESDTCNKNQCPHYQQCFYFQMRKTRQDAKIIIVNHHLLFADMILKNSGKEDAGMLPAYSRVILDEAHNIEDIATDYFASRVSQLDIMRLMARLTSEKGAKNMASCVLLKQKLHETYKNDLSKTMTSIYQRLSYRPSWQLATTYYLQTRQTFDILFHYSQTMKSKGSGASKRRPTPSRNLRLLPDDYEQHAWTQGASPAIKMLSDSLQRFSQGLLGVIADIKLLKDDYIPGNCFRDSCLRSKGFRAHSDLADETDSFIKSPPPSLSVRWIELQALKTMINTAMVDAKLDIADFLAAIVLQQNPTVSTLQRYFDDEWAVFLHPHRLGLTQNHHKDRTIKEYMYQSPFDYQSQMFLGVPNDLPFPNDPSFHAKAAQAICRIVEASHGNAFVLFTSYTMMTECFDAVKHHMQEQSFSILRNRATPTDSSS